MSDDEGLSVMLDVELRTAHCEGVKYVALEDVVALVGRYATAHGRCGNRESEKTFLDLAVTLQGCV